MGVPKITWKIVLIPGLISLFVTLLRLTGELRTWSAAWFSKETGGSIPSGLSWVIGITWLAFPFGAWFALKLGRSGIRPTRPGRSFLIAIVSLVVFYGALRLVRFLHFGFPMILIPIWSVGIVAAGIAWLGWPSLARVNALYGLSARIPVVIVMFLAMQGHWGTHYDYTGMPAQFQMPFWSGFFWLAFFPQLIFWLSFTVILGNLGGSAAALLGARWQSEPVHSLSAGGDAHQ
jgi:hypothetical protein